MADTLLNEVMYNEVLTSDGYVVDFAVCTTYSLDMPMLLSVPFMLGTMSELSDEALQAPHCVLEAINQASGKFAIFCNAGNIIVPQNLKTNIYSLLEKSIVQISLNAHGKGFVNFHPKVWIIKETKSDNPNISQLKLVVMSRNLSSSDDIDVVCELTGIIGNKEASKARLKKHKPLANFLLWLESRTPQKDIRKSIEDLRFSLSKVEKFIVDHPFEDYDFFPMGIDGYDGKETCLEEMLDYAAETIIISPFVDEGTLEAFVSSRPATKKTLVTRHASITERMLRMLNDGVYTVKEVMTDKVEKNVSVDIHEKVYFIRNGKNLLNYLYLGSTNATGNGFGRNVEFLLRLQFKPYCMSYDKFRRELINDNKDCIFEKVIDVPKQEEVDEDTIKNEQELYKAIRAIHYAKVESDGEHYRISIFCKKHIANVPVLVHPLYSPLQQQELCDGVTFNRMPLSSLTEFYIIKVDDISRVIKIDTHGMPTEERNKAIFQSIINTKSKFINYLAFMLTDSPEEFLAESQQMEHELQQSKIAGKDLEMTTSLYEDMLKAAYRTPDKIEAIQKIIEKADRNVIPENFDRMYKQFQTAIKYIKRL